MSKLTVVMYHYVRRISSSRYPGIKGIELDDFIGQVKYIKKNYNPVTIDDVIHSYSSGEELPPHALLMTFDDAYIDHFLHAYPILKKYGMQGAFFAPAKTIEEGCLLDVNKIHFILSSCNDISFLISDLAKEFDVLRAIYQVKSFDEYYAELAKPNRFDSKDVIFVKRLLQVALPEEMRNILCNKLFEKHIRMDEAAFSREIYMDKHHLMHMLNDGMHVGCHGYDHYWWNRLNRLQLASEIDKSIDFLSRLGADIENWTACYPYGSSSAEVTAYLQSRGCKLAFTTEVNVADTLSDHHLLIPRLDTNDLPKCDASEPNKWYGQ